jgi:aspartyl protease family protein
MADSTGPWKKAPSPPEGRPQRHRVLLWIALALAGALGLAELSRLFPGAISKEDEPYLVRGVILLAFVSTGLIFVRQVKLSELARNVMIWAAIGVVLVLGYTYRDELSTVSSRVESEFVPGEPIADAQAHSLTLTADSNGNFYVYGSANGTRIRFVVDTGASDIVLSSSDADRLNIDPTTLNYVRGYETANGIGAGARYTLNELAVGPIQMWNVPVTVNRTDMHASLLGMSFLRRLKSFEFQGRKLYLRW